MATKYLFKDSAGNIYKAGNSYISLPDPSLYVNDTYIPFLPAGNFQDISVYSTLMNAWEPSSGSATWITFSNKINQGGNGWGSFRATAASNSIGNRTASIVIRSKYNNWTINASQNQVIADSISLDYTDVEFDGNGNYIVGDNPTVTSSGSWTSSITYIDGTGWLSRSPTTGGTGQLVTVTCTNNTGFDRLARITFTRGTATAIFYVTQYGFV
jgi:hypothetical protein